MSQRFSRPAQAVKAAVVVASVVALGACQGAVLDPAGDIARQQRDIIYISTGLMLLIIVPVMLLIVIFAWRYRKGKGGTYDPDFDHSTGLELIIWSAPLLIIIALGALTWSSTHLLDPFRPLDKAAALQNPNAPRDKPLTVQVVSLDWKWLFIYPEQGIATVNELVLPVGRQVRFDITSSNMMNTFYAPTMAGMIYAMPGMRSSLHAVLDRPVASEGFSANYSGAGFSDMRFKLHGVDQPKFDAWVASAKNNGKALDFPAYEQLVKPSEKVPAMRFAAVDPDLFRRILERCVKKGTPCMSDLMKHDQARGGGNPHNVRPGAGMPASHQSVPAEEQQ
jgi:cytochrome o ubiquinol oxidase subunit 2